MIRLCACLLSLSLAPVSVAQDVPKPEPKKAEAKKEAPKADEKPAEGEGEEIDVHKTAERIAENAQKAGDRLKEKDPGADTRKIQEEIIKDIDALIKKAQNPPPPMNSDMSPMNPPPPNSDMMPPPMGGPGGGNQPKNKGTGSGMQPKSPMGMGTGGSSGTSGRVDRRPRRERRPRNDSPMGMGQPMGGMNPMSASAEPKESGNEKPSGDGMGDRFGKASPKRQNDKLAELYKDVWGHLPDRLRQEMDLYYREKFMPRYSELLRQYYAALAEQRKKGTEDR